jgi:hypothetical protein
LSGARRACDGLHVTEYLRLNRAQWDERAPAHAASPGYAFHKFIEDPIREGHPMLWSIDETRGDGVLAVDFSYFEREEPLVWDQDTTYVDTDVRFQNNITHQWNHGLGEIVTALLSEGFELTMLQEHDSAPWNALPGFTVADDRGEFRLADRPWRVPHTYTLQARKR